MRTLLIYAAALGCFAPLLASDQGVDANTVPGAAAVKEAPAPKVFPRADAIISAAALQDLVLKRDSSLRLIDARSKDAFDQGHISGAMNVPSDNLQATDAPPYFLASRETVGNLCKELGINADSRVVVYDDDDGRLAARVWFTLHAYGHDKVAILDGGAGKWREKSKGDRPWNTDDPTKVEAGTFQPAEALRGVASFDDLPQFRTRIHNIGGMPTTTLIDARTLAEYMGEEVRGKSGGHIPGAANIEWAALMSGKEKARVWRSPPEIHAILRVSNVDKDQKIAVYDQAGGRSAHLYFTLWLMGFEHLFNYNAGWREYGNKDGVEIEK